MGYEYNRARLSGVIDLGNQKNTYYLESYPMYRIIFFKSTFAAEFSSDIIRVGLHILEKGVWGISSYLACGLPIEVDYQ